MLLIAYVYAGVFRFQRGRGIIAPAKVRQHIAINLALFLLALAGGFYLDRFALLQSSSGAVFGAGYTDVHVKLPALSVKPVTYQGGNLSQENVFNVLIRTL